MRGRKLAAPLCLAIAFLTVGTGRAQTPLSALAHVVSGDEIRRSGAHRLADVLRLAPVFSFVSSDGFQTDGVLHSSSPFRAAAWRVAIDGRVVDRSMLGSTHLETLPVPLAAVERVVLEPPGWGPGGLSAGGWILIETIAPDSTTLNLLAAAGNEVGDPGPFRYTDPSIPNVDRSGPTLDVRISAERGRWHFETAMRADQAHLTDERVAARVLVLYDGDGRPRMSLLHPAARLRFGAPQGWLSVGADATTLRDLPFWEPVGSELPVTRRIDSADLDGWLRLDSNSSLGVAGTFSRFWFQPRPNREDLTLTWEERRATAAVRYRYTSARNELDAQLSMLSRSAKNPDVKTTIPGVGLSWFRGTGWKKRVSFGLTAPNHSGRRVLPSGSIELDSGPDALRLFLRAGLYINAPEADGGVAFWHSQGFQYPGPGLDRVGLEDELTDPRTVSADLAVIGERDGVQWGIAGFVRSFGDLNLPVEDVDPDPLFEPRYLAYQEYVAGVKGRIHGVRAWLSREFGPHLGQRVDYVYRGIASRDNLAFWQSASSLSGVEIQYRLTVSPVPRTWLSFAARFHSSSAWPSYRTEPGASETVRLPASVSLDLTVSKRFWGPRLTLFGSARNMARATIRTHPVGPEDDLTFVAGIRSTL